LAGFFYAQFKHKKIVTLNTKLSFMSVAEMKKKIAEYIELMNEDQLKYFLEYLALLKNNSENSVTSHSKEIIQERKEILRKLAGSFN
jgi:ERCC4-related helicase